MHSEGTAGRDSDHGQSSPETEPASEPYRAPEQAAAPAPHHVIDGRYELLRSLGRGGMGEVWEALDTRLDRHVAVKGLLGRDAVGAATQEQTIQRARREAAAIARIKHPNVVAVHDRVESGNQVWIVMDLLDARSLADVMRAEHRLPVRRTAAIGLQVLSGLRAVHEARVVHRDVKPANILFAKEDFAILADFGIATFDGAAPLTRAGELIGTFKYLAPELLAQTAQENTATPASDLWSLGVTLYEMVEGRHPFDRPNEYEVLVAACQSDPLPMEHGGDLAEVVGRLMHKDPRRRLSAGSAEEMLRKILRDSAAKPDPVPVPVPVPAPAPAPAPVPVPVPPQASPVPPRRPKKGVPGWQKLSAVAVCAALVAGLGWFAVERMQGDGTSEAGSRPRGGSRADPYINTHPVLKVGVKADQPGLSEKTRNGTYRGYEIDVAYAIARDMGYSRDRVTFEPVSSENRSTILQKGDVDLVIATYSITEERKHAKAPDYSVAFAGPYYVASRSFMVRRKAKAGAIDDSRMLRNKQFEVCTARSSTYESWLPKAGYNMTESLPNGYDRCVRDLLDPTSSVYAVSTDDVILAGFVKDKPAELKRLDSGPGAEGYGVAMKPDEKGLKGEVCSALKKIMTDGVWEQLYADHLAPLLNRKSPPNKPKLAECPS
ncbi:serine/threonine-protein kinase [Streptomyces sp. NPDC056323]|uniref:serine/threonine-protein kinase n=1 Tax=Streptomyces sp. NPDC056323 TaxID=3345784 RepID=UPI0035DCA64A